MDWDFIIGLVIIIYFVVQLFKYLKRKQAQKPPFWLTDEKLKASVNKKQELVLKWPAATSTTGPLEAYAIFLNGKEIATIAAEKLSIIVRDLKPGTTYNIELKAKAKSGLWSDKSLTATANIPKPIATYPTWPKNAAIKLSVEKNDATLSWPAASDKKGIAKYAVFHNDKKVATLASDERQHTIKKLTDGKHAFKVEASNTDKHWTTKGPTLNHSHSLVDIISPTWPRGAKLNIEVNGQNISGEWPAAKDKVGVVSYEILLDEQLLASFPASVRQFVSNDLDEGQHLIEVYAVDAAGNPSQRLTAGIVITKADAPPTPQWPAGAALELTQADDNIRLEWPTMAATEATKQFRLFRQTDSIATLSNTATSASYTLSGLETGTYEFGVQVGSEAGWSDKLRATIEFVMPDKQPPTWPEGATIQTSISGQDVRLSWPEATDNVLVDEYIVLVDDKESHEVSGTTLFLELKDLTVGTHQISVTARDTSGNISSPISASASIASQYKEPFWPQGSQLMCVAEAGDVAYLEWPAAKASSESSIKGYRISMNGEAHSSISAKKRSFYTEKLQKGTSYLFSIEAKDDRDNWTSEPIIATFKIEKAPTDNTLPVYSAPPVPPTVSTPYNRLLDFIYSGKNPRQTGLEDNVLTPNRISVLRGNVHDRNQSAIQGAIVSVHENPQFGQAETDANGEFNLAVNGGQQYVLNFKKDGFILLQRSSQIGWGEVQWLPEVVLLNKDSQVTKVDFSKADTANEFAGSKVKDEDGNRQARVFFPVGTSVSIHNPDGTTRPMDLLNLRITEFTEGASGLNAMPGELPPTSAYTYAIEITADEVDTKIDGKDVIFNQEVYLSVDNFLGFPVGSPAPSGYYDSDKAAWIPSQNGKVLKMLKVTNGKGVLDIEGKGKAATKKLLNELNITVAEQEFFASNFKPGESFWRIPLTHFSFWDLNWPFGPPPDAKNGASPDDKDPNPDCKKGGSIIGVQNQTLGQEVALEGTPYKLRYNSNQQTGYVAARTLNINLIDGDVPPNLKAIEVIVSILGKEVRERLEAKPNLKYRYIWDMVDGYNREVHGLFPATAKIGFVYDGMYNQPASGGNSFSRPSGVEITGSRTRREVVLWKTIEQNIGLRNASHLGLGGWSIDRHHHYDPQSQSLYMGNGSVVNVQATGQKINSVVGKAGVGFGGDGDKVEKARINTGQVCQVAPDGSYYIADWGNHRIRKVSASGIITTVAGKGSAGNSGDGGPALQAELRNPHRVISRKDGSLLIADQGNHSIRIVTPDGIINTYAGSGNSGFSGDGGPALQAEVYYPRGLAVSPDGSVYFSDCYNNRIRMIDPSGIITTVAGTGNAGYTGGGGLATAAEINQPQEVVFYDGSVYFSDQDNHCIRKITPDGKISTVAGNGKRGYTGDGGLATEAELDTPEGFGLDKNGRLYIAEQNNHCIRVVDAKGVITTFAGTGKSGNTGDGGSAINATFSEPHAIAIGYDGSIYVSDVNNHNIRKVESSTYGLAFGELMIPSPDASELHIFSNLGKHLKTLDALNGSVMYEFDYTPTGYLKEIQMQGNPSLLVKRNSMGQLAGFNSKNQTVAAVQLTADGYIAQLATPTGNAFDFTYKSGGLMTAFVYPSKREKTYEFDAQGKLIKTTDDGMVQTMEKKTIAGGSSIVITDSREATTEYQSYLLPNGQVKRVNVFASGSKAEVLFISPTEQEMHLNNGMKAKFNYAPDPRFGMQAAYLSTQTLSTPGGLLCTIQRQRNAQPTGDSDFSALQRYEEISVVNGQAQSMVYDRDQNKVSFTKSSGQLTELLMDNTLVKEVRKDGVLPIVMDYDESMRLKTVTQGKRVNQFSYDSEGRMTSMLNKKGEAIGHQLTYQGDEISMSNGADHVATVKKNKAKDKVEIVPANATSGYGYSLYPNKQLKSYHGPKTATGQTIINIDYYPGGLPKSIKYGKQQLALSYAYDKAGRMIGVKEANREVSLAYVPEREFVESIETSTGSKVQFTYDAGLVTSIISSGEVQGTLEMEYNNSFQHTKISTAAGAISFQYNSQSGQLEQAGDLLLTHDKDTLVMGQLGNITETWKLDDYGELARNEAELNLGAIATLVTLASVNYTRNMQGRITSLTRAVGDQTESKSFEYDALGRLTKSVSGTAVAEYRYDLHGNRVETKMGSQVLKAVYDAEDKLLEFGNQLYAYSTKGDLETRTDKNTGEKTQFTFDLQTNLLGVSNKEFNIEYVVDGLNQRIGKKVNQKLAQAFLYHDLFLPAAELDGNNNIVSRFVYATKGNVPDYLVKNGRTFHIITDQLGSPQLVVDADSGEIVQQMDYDAWGNIIADTNPGFQPFGFAGGLYDQHTKLTRFGYRDYDAETGRWISRDPILIAGGSTNLYAYCQNDPVNLKDPSGLVLPAIAIGIGLSVAIGGAAGFMGTEPGGSMGSNIIFGGLKGGGAAVGAVLYGPPGAAVGAGLMAAAEQAFNPSGPGGSFSWSKVGSSAAFGLAGGAAGRGAGWLLDDAARLFPGLGELVGAGIGAQLNLLQIPMEYTPPPCPDSKAP